VKKGRGSPACGRRRRRGTDGRRPWLVVAACAALLAGFALVSWLAVREKNATYDEPLHSVAAWTLSNRHDFRINPEDPCLWQYWAALPQSAQALRPDFSWNVWDGILGNADLHTPWVVRAALFGAGGARD